MAVRVCSIASATASFMPSFCASSKREEPRHIFLKGFEDAASVDSLRRVSGVGKILLRHLVVSTVHGRVGGVEVGGLALREHSHSHVEHLVIFRAAMRIAVGKEEELILAQVLRTGLHHLADFVDVEIFAYGVGYPIVGVAQRRVDVGQDEVIVLRET